jgi:hypothetical protein
MIPSLDSILLIHGDRCAITDLVDSVDDQRYLWISVHRFSEAIQAQNPQRKAFSIVVCDWELFQACRDDLVEYQCIHKLLAEGSPLIFVSANQIPSVKFTPFLGRPIYSVKLSDWKTLFPVLVDLTLRLATKYPPAGTQREREPKRTVPAAAHSSFHRPHFPNPIVVEPSMVNSTLHAFH